MAISAKGGGYLYHGWECRLRCCAMMPGFHNIGIGFRVAWAPTVFLQEITVNLPSQIQKGWRVGYTPLSTTVGMILGFGAGAAGVFELSNDVRAWSD